MVTSRTGVSSHRIAGEWPWALHAAYVNGSNPEAYSPLSLSQSLSDGDYMEIGTGPDGRATIVAPPSLMSEFARNGVSRNVYFEVDDDGFGHYLASPHGAVGTGSLRRISRSGDLDDYDRESEGEYTDGESSNSENSSLRVRLNQVKVSARAPGNVELRLASQVGDCECCGEKHELTEMNKSVVVTSIEETTKSAELEDLPNTFRWVHIDII